jgi:hypothetical protein
MSEWKHDGPNSVETASELAQDRKTGPRDRGPGGAAALRAESDGIPVVAGKVNKKDRRNDSGRGRGGPSYGLANTLGELAMNNGEQESNLPLGLDVGTSRIVVARSMDRTNQSQYESQLNAFITMPYSKLAESLLEREGVFHEVFGGELVVTGNDAQRFAEVFHVETRRPMLRGVLNPQEPHSLPVMRSIISRLVGKAGVAGRKIFFSIPAPCPDGDQAIAYHEASIRRF